MWGLMHILFPLRGVAMSKPISFEALDFKVVSSMDETRSRPEPETPFRICILGDFSGRSNRGIVDPSFAFEKPRPIKVDRDNIEDVMKKLGVNVQLSLADESGPPVVIRFEELDDFHPEQLYARLDVFQRLRETRKRLNDLRTYASAKKEIQSWMGADETSRPPDPALKKPPPKPASSGQVSGSLLDQIVGEAEGRRPDTRTVSAPSEWDAFLQKIVGPHLVPGDDPEQEELVAAVDASISGLMQTILHHPDFQAIESAWRALRFLVNRVETDALLKVYLLDISKDELAADLRASDDLETTGTYRLFVEQATGIPGGEPWAMLAGNYTFDKTREDAEILGRMAIIARLAGATFISAAHDHFLGCDSLAHTPDSDDWKRSVDAKDRQAWEALREFPDVTYLGLVLPRFLLRLPYGEACDPVNYFDFEEMPEGSAHENYLWGNPSFACALLLAQAFSRYGWNLRPGVIQDIGGLPLHVYKKQGESVIKPCAEVIFTEKAMQRILDLGVMPLLSYKNQDTVRLARFQSVADPLTQLSGPWV
jgi:type VI secretion system protein ImpC